MPRIQIIGAGLAGSEAALTLADSGAAVDLYEMRPQKMTPAHRTGEFAELVCSNSLKSRQVTAAHGLLKEELRVLNSRLLSIAEGLALPAGQSLAVDRTAFSLAVTQAIESHPMIAVHRQEVKSLKGEGIIILCAGPLIAEELAQNLGKQIGEEGLFFFDAVAPILDGSSLDLKKLFQGSRYEKGTPDFLNSPMTREEYLAFCNALLRAKVHALHDFEEDHFFEGCLPVEEIARRGERSLAFGPLRPVGLIDPRTGRRPYAVAQLRRENAEGSLWNLVGFQTRLCESEQERVFRMIPGLERAQFFRFGKMHRNTFLCAPKVLDPYLRLRIMPHVFVAGQLCGSEGYTEAMITGHLCAIQAARLAKGLNPVSPPDESAVGSLVRHLTCAEAKNFQPMNFSFGLLPPLAQEIHDKKKKKEMLAQRALASLLGWRAHLNP